MPERNDYSMEADTRVQSYYDTGKRLRISDILYAVRKRLILILICTAIGLALGVVLSIVSYMRGEMSKQYTITCSIAVTSQNENGLFTSQGATPGSNDIYLAEEMVDSVIYVMKSDRMLNRVIERLNILGIANKDIANNLRMQQHNETQIIEVTLYWRSSQEGVEILTAMMDVAPAVLIETLKIGNVLVVNEPTAKYLIGGSLNAAMWVYMTLLGAMIGIGIAVLELLLRPTLLNPKDVEDYLGLEILSEIPESSNFFKKKHNLVTQEAMDANPGIIDNYQSLAHIVRRNLKDNPHSCVYITSAGTNEGKTTVVACLSVFLAELGMKVLAVDFDTRNPRLGGEFLNRVDYNHSLNALYHGDISASGAVTNITGKLDLLPAVLERNPLPIDDGMLSLIEGLRESYDIILMDTSPVGQVANTMSLNELADIAVFVLRFDGSSMDNIRESLTRLNKTGIPIMGCVVNQVRKLTNLGDFNAGYGAGNDGVNRFSRSESDSRRSSSRKRRFNSKKEQQPEILEDTTSENVDASDSQSTEERMDEEEETT